MGKPKNPILLTLPTAEEMRLADMLRVLYRQNPQLWRQIFEFTAVELRSPYKRGSAQTVAQNRP